MKIHLVVEKGEAIWFASKKRKHAKKFMQREFKGNPNVRLMKLHVHKSLVHAPTSDGDSLPAALDLSVTPA